LLIVIDITVIGKRRVEQLINAFPQRWGWRCDAAKMDRPSLVIEDICLTLQKLVGKRNAAILKRVAVHHAQTIEPMRVHGVRDLELSRSVAKQTPGQPCRNAALHRQIFNDAGLCLGLEVVFEVIDWHSPCLSWAMGRRMPLL